MKKIKLPEEIQSELELDKLSYYRKKLRLFKDEFPELKEEFEKVSKLVYAYEQEHCNKPIDEIDESFFDDKSEQ